MRERAPSMRVVGIHAARLARSAIRWGKMGFSNFFFCCWSFFGRESKLHRIGAPGKKKKTHSRCGQQEALLPNPSMQMTEGRAVTRFPPAKPGGVAPALREVECRSDTQTAFKSAPKKLGKNKNPTTDHPLAARSRASVAPPRGQCCRYCPGRFQWSGGSVWRCGRFFFSLRLAH